MDWVFENSEATGDDRLILLHVAHDFDVAYGGAPRFDLARIARRTGLSEHLAQQAIVRLTDAGRIVLALGSVYLPRVP